VKRNSSEVVDPIAIITMIGHDYSIVFGLDNRFLQTVLQCQ